jgi:hypothetical protein
MSNDPNQLATACVQDLIDKIVALEGFTGRVWHVYDEKELRQKDKGLAPTEKVGIIYDGLRVLPPPDNQPAGRASDGGGGCTAEMSFSVVMYLSLQPIALDDPKIPAITKVDTIRKAIIRTRSPSGHFWKFRLEVAAAPGKESAFLQKWTTTVQL